MKITFIGHGNVGGSLANSLQRVGFDVSVATDDLSSESVRKLKSKNEKISLKPPQVALSAADVVFIAVPFAALSEVVKEFKTVLANKIIVDCTNPVGPGLSHGLNSKESGSRWLQNELGQSKVVKAFSVYGFENFEFDSTRKSRSIRPAMFFCGEDLAAKNVVSEMISKLAWEPVDVGGIDQALHLEHMTLLWIKMVRVGGISARTLWAKITES